MNNKRLVAGGVDSAKSRRCRKWGNEWNLVLVVHMYTTTCVILYIYNYIYESYMTHIFYYILLCTLSGSIPGTIAYYMLCYAY